MVLAIISLIVAALAVIGCIYLFIRLAATNAEAERLGWEVKGVETTVSSLQKKVDAQPKETIVAGLEGVKYDPKTTTMTIGGNLVVKGGIATGGIIKED